MIILSKTQNIIGPVFTSLQIWVFFVCFNGDELMKGV